MGIKLIVCDIDGTLIDKDEIVSERLITAVKACRNYGIGFTVNSGRTEELVKDIVQKLDISEPYVAANGACIFRKGICIDKEGFTAEPIKEIIKVADDMGLTVTISNAYTEQALSVTDYILEHRKFDGRFNKILPYSEINWSKQFVKIMFMDEHQSGKIRIIRDMLKIYDSIYWITTYSDKAVEIGPLHCNKATGMKKVAALLNISSDEIMACGDYENDYEMIMAAGIGVAVGNACQQLKSVADYVAHHNYYGGVLEAIGKFCCREK